MKPPTVYRRSRCKPLFCVVYLPHGGNVHRNTGLIRPDLAQEWAELLQAEINRPKIDLTPTATQPTLF